MAGHPLILGYPWGSTPGNGSVAGASSSWEPGSGSTSGTPVAFSRALSSSGGVEIPFGDAAYVGAVGGLPTRTNRAMKRASQSWICGQSWSVPSVADSSSGCGNGASRNSGWLARKVYRRMSVVSLCVTVETE